MIKDGVDDLYKDIQAKAFEFIKDKVSELDLEDVPELVAGLLMVMSPQEIRSLLGFGHDNDKGLYICTGGLTKDERYEAERGRIPVTLLDMDDLVKALLEHYERMDLDMQRLIPLRKLYWPV